MLIIASVHHCSANQEQVASTCELRVVAGREGRWGRGGPGTLASLRPLEAQAPLGAKLPAAIWGDGRRVPRRPAWLARGLRRGVSGRRGRAGGQAGSRRRDSSTTQYYPASSSDSPTRAAAARAAPARGWGSLAEAEGRPKRWSIDRTQGYIYIYSHDRTVTTVLSWANTRPPHSQP